MVFNNKSKKPTTNKTVSLTVFMGNTYPRKKYGCSEIYEPVYSFCKTLLQKPKSATRGKGVSEISPALTHVLV